MTNSQFDIRFHARLSITDHFDNLINNLDINTEILLMKTHSSSEFNEINDLRDEFITKVKEIEHFNLENLKIYDNDLWADLKLIFRNKEENEENEELFKSFVILNDCFLLKDYKSKIGFSLIITDWYTPKKQLEFLKNFNTNGKNNANIFHEIHLETLDQISVKNMCILEFKKDMTKNRIKDFRNTRFDQIRKFTMTNVKVNFVKDLPFSILKNLTKLEIFDCALMKNKNRSISRIFSNLNNLEELYLSDKTIDSIENDAFKNLTKLKILNLMFCKISSITNKLFSNLVELEVLDISYNPLIIEDDAFKNLFKLKILNLNCSRLRVINSKLFENLFNLEKLYLSRNRIYELDENAFKNLKKLKKLMLNDCHLNKISKKLFRNLMSLETLCISENPIAQSINEDAFSYLNKLKKLFLNNCQMTNVTAKMFKNLINLEELDISNNHLVFTNDSIFKYLNNLKVLNLNDCNLKYINNNLLKHLTNLEELDLSSNQIINHDIFKTLDRRIQIYI